MIEITFNTAFMLYLCLTLTILLGVWAYYHLQERNRIIVSSEKKLIICEYCHFAYVDRSLKVIHQCPQCQLFSKGKIE
jgi:ribosomal protein L37AE/L43A